MAAIAEIKDGKIVESSSESSLKNSGKLNKSGMDKDSFLQLLVAQMQYQDPLEPTSNTEFISQYAQFSQVEQIQNMAQSTDLQRAGNLVGKQVYIETIDSKGAPVTKQGKVDYVIYEAGKAYLCINEEMYSIDDLTIVADEEYLEAYDKALDFVTALNKLPNVNGVDLSDGEAIDKLKETYDKMTDYQKTFIAKEKVDALNKYVDRIKDLRAQEEASKPQDPDTGGEDDDK